MIRIRCLNFKTIECISIFKSSFRRKDKIHVCTISTLYFLLLDDAMGQPTLNDQLGRIACFNRKRLHPLNYPKLNTGSIHDPGQKLCVGGVHLRKKIKGGGAGVK